MNQALFTTQNEYLLENDVTLMTTSNLDGNIIQANDAFIFVGGYFLA